MQVYHDSAGWWLGSFKSMLKLIYSNKGLLFIALGNLVGALLTGSFWLLIATTQDADQYGKTNYLVAMASLACSIALFGLNTTVTTFNAKGLKNISLQANQLTLFSGVIAAIFVSIFSDWYAGLFVVSMVFWMMSSYDLLGKKLYKQYALVIVGARGSQLLLSLILYFVLGIEGIILGFVISFFVFSYRYLGSMRMFNFKFNEVKGKLKFSMHAYSFNMSTSFLMFFDKLVILPLFGYTVLGQYQISLQLLLLVGMIPISLYQYLLSEESSGSRKTRLRYVGFAISVVLAATLFFASPWLIETYFPNFIDSIVAVKITSIGIVPMTIVWTINSRLFTTGQTRFIAVGSAIYVSVQVVLILLLGREFGVPGLATALVLALGAQSTFLFLGQNKLKKKILLEETMGSRLAKKTDTK